MINEVLPAGNDFSWVYSNENIPPNLGISINDSSEISKDFQQFIDGIKHEYLVPGWEFNSFIGNEHFFMTVFTHPLRIALLDQVPDCEFINPRHLITRADYPGNQWDVATQPIDDLLRGTNLYPARLWGAYNKIGAYKDGDQIKMGATNRAEDNLAFYQTGVALVRANLITNQDKIAHVDDQIIRLTQRFQSELQPLLSLREQLQSSIVPYQKEFPINFINLEG